MNFSHLENITEGRCIQFFADRGVTDLATDSRKAIPHEGLIFCSITGTRHDGHTFIRHLYDQGVRQFIVEKDVVEPLPEANILRVANTILALQQIVQHHRKSFTIPVIGISGSNGKTIIKEWLFQLLSQEYFIVKNPGSFNSQTGVPLSVWGIQPYHQLGIFEAGISKPGEMENLKRVIQPTIGIFTNIGTAHDEGFKNQEEKIAEKLKLFKDVKVLICCLDHSAIFQQAKLGHLPTYTWGLKKEADLFIQPHPDHYAVKTSRDEFSITLPFKDRASIENCFHCMAVMHYLNYSPVVIQQRLQFLRTIPMRLELKEGINNCQVVDDAYNNDLGGLQISLDFLIHQKQKNKKRVILSDIQQSGMMENELAEKIAVLINRNEIAFFEGIGPVLTKFQHLFQLPSQFYSSTQDFLEKFISDNYNDEIILVKGARTFQFEKIVQRLQRKLHGTVIEINLGALIHNLNFFRSKISSPTKIMVMVKAFAYGSGSIEIANVLQYNRVDYLGVAYTDEGVDLRKNNITLPIMVMNPTEGDFDQLLSFQLEPEIYSLRILRSLIDYLADRPCSVHLKLDTGMHRLGFDEADLGELRALLKAHKNIQVASIFSHLAGADETEHDIFSTEQGTKFVLWAITIVESLGYKPLFHILNSSGILRLPQWHLDMVRLGIGLYGIDPAQRNKHLLPVATLKTIISQIKQIKKGKTIGYGRSGKADEDMVTATLAIGYADGYNRAFSNGIGEVLINGRRAPVIGNVCMDMTMVNVTGIEAHEGDEVILFGEGLPIQEVASKINTIAYEILTNTSDRVKRVFVAEGI